MRMSVKTGIIASAVAMIVVLCAQGLLGLSQLAAVHSATEDLVVNRFTSAELIGEIEAVTARYRLRMMRYVVNAETARAEGIETQLSQSAVRVAQIFARYEARQTGGASPTWQAFRARWAAYVPLQEAALEAARTGDPTRATALVEASTDAFEEVVTALRAESRHNQDLSYASIRLAGRTYDEARSALAVFSVIAVALGIAIAVLVLGRFSRPLRSLRCAMQSVADGRFETIIPSTDRHDEIGDMARTLVLFRDALETADRTRNEQAQLDAANLKLIAEAQRAELDAIDQARDVLIDLAESLDAQVDEKTRHVVEREREIVRRLSQATERRDNDTGAHIVRMGRICGIVAEALGLPESDCRDIEIAAQMHDIGKVGIPDEILFKPGRLTPDERRVMETHATLGWEILEGSEAPLIRLAAEVALSHHERWDGAGYPNHLAGEDIPLSGRIAALADVFDALTAVRPYKPAWSIDKALAFVRDNSGSHFDPAVVDAFFSRIDDVLVMLSENGERELVA